MRLQKSRLSIDTIFTVAKTLCSCNVNKIPPRIFRWITKDHTSCKRSAAEIRFPEVNSMPLRFVLTKTSPFPFENMNSSGLMSASLQRLRRCSPKWKPKTWTKIVFEPAHKITHPNNLEPKKNCPRCKLHVLPVSGILFPKSILVVQQWWYAKISATQLTMQLESNHARRKKIELTS